MTNPRPIWTGPIALVVLATTAAAFAEPPPASAKQQASVDTPEAVFAAWDTDANGALSSAEFTAGWTRVSQAALRRNLQGQFARHDLDRNGALDATEMAQLELVRRAGAGAPALSRFDGNRSGGLDFQEYLALVSALAGEPNRARR